MDTGSCRATRGARSSFLFSYTLNLLATLGGIPLARLASRPMVTDHERGFADWISTRRQAEVSGVSSHFALPLLGGP